jgi:hypothetical protein
VPRVQIELGATIDTLNADELRAAMNDQALIESEREMERLRGISVQRIPQVSVTGASPFVSTSGNAPSGPRDGYLWVVKRWFVTGLTSGATPDVMNIYADSTTSQPLWQLTGNTPGAVFGNFSQFLLPGQTIVIASVGTITSTAQITLSGDAISIPMVMAAKLV